MPDRLSSIGPECSNDDIILAALGPLNLASLFGSCRMRTRPTLSLAFCMDDLRLKVQVTSLSALHAGHHSTP